MAEMMAPPFEDDTHNPNEYAQLATPEANEMIELDVPEAWVIDYDRTLGDVSAAMDRLLTVAKHYGVDTEQIKTAQAAVEADGGSFDPLSYVESSLSDTTSPNYDELAYTAFCERFTSIDEPPLMYPDAQRFLDRLSDSGIPTVVMTYGTNKHWQQLKLAASGYTGAVKIMDHTDKGVDMEAMRSEQGTFDFATSGDGESTIHANRLGLIDDKAKSFSSLPADSHGYLVQRGEQLPSQQGEVPPQVAVISSLDELAIADGRILRQPVELSEHFPATVDRERVAPVAYLPLTTTGELNPDYQMAA